MSSISSLFKGYNANRKPKVRKGVPYGRCADVITAEQQFKRLWPKVKVSGEFLMQAGFRDIRYHYTKGWRIA